MFRWMQAMLLGVVMAVPAMAETPAPRPIHVNGEAVVYVSPDEVVINLGVETFNPNLDEAKAENDDRSKRLLAAIKELGVEDAQINTSEMQVEIVYFQEGGSGHRRKVDGYRCQRMYSITLKKTDLLEPVVNAALNNGANQMQGIEFRTTELRKHRDEARRMAMRAAKEKAELMAGEIGVKIGAPLSISEQEIHLYSPRQNMMQNLFEMLPAATESGETLPPGQIGVRANVAVSFELVISNE